MTKTAQTDAATLKRIPARKAGYGQVQGTCDYETSDGRFHITKIWCGEVVWQCRATDGSKPFRSGRSDIYNGDTLADVRYEIALATS